MSIRDKIKSLLQPGEGLYQRTIRSGGWAFALRITEQGFGLIRLIILARVLAVNDFGLLGIALLAMMTLETFSQTGFQAALIQKKEKTEEYLDAAWTVSALRGLVLFVILFLIAPYVAIFFDVPVATPIIQVIAVTSLLQGLTNVGTVYFRKELQFNKQFLLQASGTLADFAVAVSVALILQSVWALVFGVLAAAFVRLIVSYLIHPYRPHFTMHLGKARELFGFGKWVLGSSILLFLVMQGDDIFVGKLLGVTLLGFYQMAYRFSNAPATEITQVISQVTFPAYAKLQDNLPGLREGYLRTLQLTAFIAVPMAGGIFILAPEFTTILLGDKWMPMVPAMQALALWGLIRAIGGTMGPLFQGIGRPDIVTKSAAARLIILAALIYPLSMTWGILGTSLAVLIGSFFTIPVLYYIVVNRMLKSSSRYFAKITMLIPLVSTLLMVLLISLFTVGNVSLVEFVLLVLGGAAFYFAVSYGLDRALKYGIWKNIRSAVSEGLR